MPVFFLLVVLIDGLELGENLQLQISHGENNRRLSFIGMFVRSKFN
jgi:hypothetical protein